MGRTRKPWGERFGEETDPAVERFSASVSFDKTLARYDIRGSIAHARMLGSVGLLAEADVETLVQGLESLAAEIEAGEFRFDPALEDIHMNIEARLQERVGGVAGRLHTGRSRNAQVATDLALYLRDMCDAIQRGLLALQSVLVARAREHFEIAAGQAPDNALVLFRLGHVLQAAGESSRANEMIARARAIDPSLEE